jgi:hypothetical protein
MAPASRLPRKTPTTRPPKPAFSCRARGLIIHGLTIFLALAFAWAMTAGAQTSNSVPLASNSPAAAFPAGATNTQASAKPPLLGGEEPLLLLDDTPATNAPAGGADNSRCQVCHLNFMQESLTVSHARTNIGCATCHGECDAHIADESWASGGNGTPPEIMFPRSKIYAACIACHKPEQVFVKIEKHKPVWWTIAYQERVCTECHGQHRMVIRRCKWK